MSDPYREIDQAFLVMQRALTSSFSSHDSMFGRVEMSTLWVLDALWRNPTDELMTIGDIAATLHIAPSTASRFVARAQIAGTIVKIRSTRDGRHVCIAFTDRGEAMARAAERWRFTFLRGHTTGWTENELDTFGALLTKFGASLTVGDTPESPQTEGKASR